MKKFITPSYVFTPGSSGVGTVDLSSIGTSFNAKKLISIINQTRGLVIYSTASTSLKYTNISGNVITLFADTTGQSSGDSLQVIYEDSQTEDSLVSINTNTAGASLSNELLMDMLTCLRQLANPVSTEPASGRLRVVLDPLGGAQTLGTVTTVSTVTAVTTVGTLTSMSQIGTVPANSFVYDQMHMSWASTVRPRIA